MAVRLNFGATDTDQYLNEDIFNQRENYFRALIERIGIAWVKRREKNNAIVERSRERIPLFPHYIKIHTWVSKKCSTAKRDRKERIWNCLDIRLGILEKSKKRNKKIKNKMNGSKRRHLSAILSLWRRAIC